MTCALYMRRERVTGLRSQHPLLAVQGAAGAGRFLGYPRLPPPPCPQAADEVYETESEPEDVADADFSESVCILRAGQMGAQKD